MAYTYDDFVSAAEGAGLYGTFCQKDLTTAQSRPEYGMSLLKLRQEYDGASTAEQRLLAQEAMNQLRHSYTPADSGRGQSGQNGQSAYEQALQDVTGYPEYSYDYLTDPIYVQARDQYLADIRDSTGQVLGNAQVTGGSQAPGYAGAAAGQSGNYYSTRLNDVIPTMEQNAYTQYLQNLGIKNDQLSAVSGEKNFDYNKQLQEQALSMAAQQQAFSNQLALHQNFDTAVPELPDLYGTGRGSGVQYSYGREGELQKALSEVMNQEGFSYDVASDPLYGSLRKTYLREGQRAGENALATASSGSMGVPSSYAIRVAADAQNGYMEQLMNGMPALEGNAYNRYLQEFAGKMAALEALNADREMNFNQWLQNYQLEQQRKQQMFDNALTMYGVTGLTPEIAAILGVPYDAPSGGGSDEEESTGVALTPEQRMENLVNNMLNNASSSRLDPERVINGLPSETYTTEQKEYAVEYLNGLLAGGAMKGGS